jgi:glutamate:GABA antiporter
MNEQTSQLRRELGLRDVVLFNIAALVSTRWIGVAAHIGPGAITLWLLGVLLFLLPCAFVVAELSQRFPREGGLYVWTNEAFGPWHAFACAAFYYLNNLFWIPGLLISLVGMTTYALVPGLARWAENPWFVLPCALALLAVITVANYLGLRVAKWVDNLGGLAVYLIVALLIVVAGSAALRHGFATPMNIVPRLDVEKLNFWSQMAMALTGLELSAILSGEVRDAKRTLFRATWISAVAVAFFYVVSTGALLVLLPPEQISTVIGLAQAGRQAGQTLGWAWVPYAVGIAILLSAGGQLGTYLGACSRLPFVLGIDRFLPPAFARLHPRYGTPVVSILLLGIGSGLLLIISQLGESFRGAYQVTVDMTVISLFVPFLYIFAAAWRFGQKLAAICGLAVSAIAIGFSFLPTSDVRSVWGFEAKLVGGCALLFVLTRLCYRHYSASAATAGAAGPQL